MNTVKENKSWTVFKAVKTDANPETTAKGKGEARVILGSTRIQQEKVGICSQGAGCRGQGMEKTERIARE